MKGVGKLSWFMSKPETATSPPREGEIAGTTDELIFDTKIYLCCTLFIHYSLLHPSPQLAYRAATKFFHPCLLLASLWMVPQVWFMFFISASSCIILIEQ